MVKDEELVNFRNICVQDAQAQKKASRGSDVLGETTEEWEGSWSLIITTVLIVVNKKIARPLCG